MKVWIQVGEILKQFDSISASVIVEFARIPRTVVDLDIFFLFLSYTELINISQSLSIVNKSDHSSLQAFKPSISSPPA